MKKEYWYIEDNRLYVEYETYTNKKYIKVFYLANKIEDKFIIKALGTNYSISLMYCNICKLYTAYRNNTNLNCHINCDLKKLKVVHINK